MRKAGFEATVRAMAEEAEAELSRLVTHVNDAIVPEVRRSSAAGLRVAAEQIRRLAEQLDRPPARRATPTGTYADRAAQGRGC